LTSRANIDGGVHGLCSPPALGHSFHTFTISIVHIIIIITNQRIRLILQIFTPINEDPPVG